MNIPKWHTYCANTTPANALCFEMGEGFDVYFSYHTPIAFRHDGRLVIRENEWGQTTGKHLNAIDRDKSKRIDGLDFEIELHEVIS